MWWLVRICPCASVIIPEPVTSVRRLSFGRCLDVHDDGIHALGISMIVFWSA
jgi:hypothetical protein